MLSCDNDSPICSSPHSLVDMVAKYSVLELSGRDFATLVLIVSARQDWNYFTFAERLEEIQCYIDSLATCSKSTGTTK